MWQNAQTSDLGAVRYVHSKPGMSAAAPHSTAMAFVMPVMCAGPVSDGSAQDDQTSPAVPSPSPSTANDASPPLTTPDDFSSEFGNGVYRPPRFRRSKLLLTRRVYTMRLPASGRRGKNSAAAAPPPPPPMPAIPLPPVVPDSPEPFRPERYLDPAPPVPAYFFVRGVQIFSNRRRSGDPPARYLELRRGLVDVDSPHSHDCANPCATWQMKRWYSNAIRWKALHKDFRPVLPLGAERIVGKKPDLPAPEAEKLQKKTAIDAGEHVLKSSLFAPEAFSSVFDQPLPLSPLLVSEGSSVGRALARSPRVIIIGDIHGCIDEFQSLLRLADFQPGDQVVLLGDLVAKGPDSIGVVQMSRDIGARTVVRFSRH